MKRTTSTGFYTVFQTEVLFNLKRIAPFALMILFSANALLWWGWGPAITRGWAVNSDFFIVWLLGGFSFITMPLFIALMMGDPVIRDFRIGIDPLIFSKPISRVAYLLGKFFGNFFVLVCCQACFILTLLLLQPFSKQGMIVLSPRLLPYLQHFFFFVVVSSLALGAICFTVGTLTRNVKIVYGLAVSFYFLFIAWQVAIKPLPLQWRIALDPLLFNIGGETWKTNSADLLNRITMTYDGYMIANRFAMLTVAFIFLGVLCARFSIAERVNRNAKQQTALLNLAPSATERLYNDSNDSRAKSLGAADVPRVVEAINGKQVALPQVNIATGGLSAGFEQFKAALGVEFRLLRAERSLVVVAPLVILLCVVEIAAYEVVPDVSYSATYASRTVESLLLFLFAIAVFYTGEMMHRDRELRIEPVLWSFPAPNIVLLLSKFSVTLLLSLSLMTLVAVSAIVLQIYNGHAPLELQMYLKTYALILVPSVVFMIAAATALNILLRDKYLTYVASLGLGGGFYYLTSQGYNHWLYNPLLYRLWTPSDLVNGGSTLTRILVHRIYSLALSTLLLAIALLFFERKSTRGLMAEGRLSGAGWSTLVIVVSVAVAVMTGWIISYGI